MNEKHSPQLHKVRPGGHGNGAVLLFFYRTLASQSDLQYKTKLTDWLTAPLQILCLERQHFSSKSWSQLVHINVNYNVILAM